MNERTLLRRSRTPMGADAAFLTPSGIDVDSTQNYEVVRRKVFFDDVHLVTIHRERGIAFLIVTGVFATFFTGLAILIVAIETSAWPWALPFLAIGLMFAVAFLLRASMGRDVITVFGRRSKAVLRFGSLGQNRAREVYGQICSAVRRAQSAIPTAPPQAPAMSPDIPMPPDLPA